MFAVYCSHEPFSLFIERRRAFVGVFVVVNVPEAVVIHGDDGALTITGLSRTSQRVSIHADGSVPVGEPLLGLVYRVDPANVPLDAPMVLSFAKRADLGTENATTVYQWNSSLGMWVPVPSVVADTVDVLAVEVLSFGFFALGMMPEIDVPMLLTAQDTLRAKASVVAVSVINRIHASSRRASGGQHR